MSSNSLRGQWLGPYTGSSTNGQLIVNIDEIDGKFIGRAYVCADTNTVPTTLALFSVSYEQYTTTADLLSIHPHTSDRLLPKDLKVLYPNIRFSSKADISFTRTENTLTIDATSDLDLRLKAELKRSSGIEQSKIPGSTMSWTQFKSHVDTFSKSTHLFRGQQKPWALCTAFHRRERYIINRFISEDVKKLHQKISAITPHLFDLLQPEQNGAFFHLLQHHCLTGPTLHM